MKKHFLLFVMALMSLTTWAATDIKTCQVNTGNIEYGTAALPAYEVRPGGDGGSTLIDNTHYTVTKKVFRDAACSIVAAENVDAIATLAIGEYYIQVVGKGVYEGTTSQSFEITKKTVKLPVTGGLTKVFGAADPVITADKLDWAHAEGFTTADAAAGTAGTLATVTSCAYSYSGTAVGTYPATFTGITATNYIFVEKTGMVITQKSLTSEDIKFTSEVYEATYTGVAPTPAYEIKDGAKDLTVNTDYTVAVTSASANVGKYTVTVTGIGNYQDAVTLTSTADKDKGLVIKPAPLTVLAVDQEKVYDGDWTLKKVDYAAKAVTILGFVHGETDDKITTKPVVAVVENTGGAKANVGTYTIQPSGAVAENNNYSFNYVNGSFTINKKDLTITAADADKVYGNADPAFTCTIAGAVGAEETTMRALIDNSTPAKAEETKDNGDIKISRTNADVNTKGEYKDVIVVTYNTAAPVFANYNITNKAGKFTIKGGTIFITVLPHEMEYGSAEPDWANPVEGKDYIVNGLSTGDKLTKAPTLTRAGAATVVVGTTYTVTADGAEYPAGYDGVTYIPGTLTVKAKTLKVTAQAQSLELGQKENNLDITLITIDSKKGLVNGDKASDVLELKFNGVPVDGAGKLTDAGEYKGGIKVALKAAGNYTLEYTAGDLTVIDPEATITLNRVAKADFADNTKNTAAAVIKEWAEKYAATPEDVLHTTETATTYNNTELAGHYTAGDVITYAKATEYEAAGATPALAVGAGLFTAGQAEAYNATLTGLIAEKAGISAEEATDFNSTLGLVDDTDPRWKDAGDDFEASDVAAYNAAKGALAENARITDANAATYSEKVTDELLALATFTSAQATAYNATLPGAKKAGDVKDAAATKNVTFSDFEMLPEKWYPIVLPFATSVAEVSKIFDYAVVNVLNKENTDETKIAFKLHMQDIPANEPFVVKIKSAMNMSAAVFYGKGLIAPADYKNVSVEDASGVKFIGTYTGKDDGFRSDEYYFSTSADYNQYYQGNATNKTYLRPLGAYFKVPANSAARTIEFEEADGTVTAIQAVNVKAEAMSAEGWYTIGGVKLQGAPAQKGVYIQNGKKVVVK